MRTLVYEPRVGGHFLNLAGQVARALAEAGAESHVATVASAPGSIEYESSIAPLQDLVTIHTNVLQGEGGGALAIARANYSALESCIDELRPDRIYLPTADAVVQLVAMARLVGRDTIYKRTHIEGLLMNGSVAHPELLSRAEHWKRRFYHEAAKRGCHTVFHLNQFVRDWELTRGLPPEHCVKTMPDPVEVVEISKSDARLALGLPPDRRIVGMVGRLDLRKGAHVLIEAFLQAQLTRHDLLLLWGPLARELRPYVERLEARTDLRDRVLLRDSVLEPEQFYQAIAAMDVLALPYTATIGSSSIVIRAAAAGRPVVTTEGGWSERVMRRFPLGWSFPGPDPNELARLLPRCLEESESWVPSAITRRFVSYNSPENFAAHWSDGVRRALGKPSHPALMSWAELVGSTSA